MPEGHTERLEAALTGRYRIERKLGEGGMASVYLAEDIKHERKVALKILRPELAAVIGAERFLSEIKTTANLQHPHILPLFDSGELGGYLYYVMPYVDGETLRDKLDREKQLGVEESVRIARDVSDALDYAHRHGVIHRDIKPANILLHDGRPVVADFGIALAVSAAGGGRMTETGLSLGTPHYMSPEQASADRDLSARSDVYSLGCVLYEMIAGQPPHTGPSAQSILVHILTKEATPLTELRHTVPPHVAATVAKAIEKLPADRFESAKAFREALDDVGFKYQAGPRTAAATTAVPTTATSLPAAVPSRPWLRDGRSVAAVVGMMAMTALAAWGWLQPGPEPGVATRSELTGVNLASTLGGWRLAISPDGRWIVAGHAEPGGTPALYIRSASDTEWRRLPNTEGGSNPTFSPDGQWVAFDNSNSSGIAKVPITGGPALPITTSGGTPHWGADDTIVYAAGLRLLRIPSSGGEPEVLLEGVLVQRPYLLPGGRGVVFGTGSAASSQIRLLDVETGEVQELVAAGNQPRYLPTGHLIYGHGDGALMAVAFDLDALQVTGAPVTLLPELSVYSGGASQFAVSESGTLVYSVGDSPGLTGGGSGVLVSVDLDGTEAPIAGPRGDLVYPRYSPDGAMIAYQEGTDIRLYDLIRGSNPQFSSEGGVVPTWSSNGAILYYIDPSDLSTMVRRTDSSEEARELWQAGQTGYVADTGPGDSVLVLVAQSNVVLAREGPDGPEFEDFLVTPWNAVNVDVSPDGRWIAYQSDESGEFRIYVHSFPAITGRVSVSPGLGVDPRWAPDGRSLYYRSGLQLLSVDVETAAAFVASAPRVAVDLTGEYELEAVGGIRNWDLHPDGSRFVFVKASGGPIGLTDARVYIVTDWFQELRERMGG